MYQISKHTLGLQVSLEWLHKKENSELQTNFRPISLLPQVLKTNTSLINKTIIQFSNSTMLESQNGLRSTNSTHDNLDEIIAKKRNALDQNEKRIALFLDFSKAFESVLHSWIINSLH